VGKILIIQVINYLQERKKNLYPEINLIDKFFIRIDKTLKLAGAKLLIHYLLFQLWDASVNKRVRAMSGHPTRVGSLDWNQHILTR